MKIEYFEYYPMMKKAGKFYPKGNRKYVSIADIRKQLPDHIVKELLQHPHPQNCIEVETYKTDVVVYLNRLMKIENYDFGRGHNIEITEDEIDNYDYFFIALRDLNWGQQINYDFSRPTCKIEACPYGAQITSPTRINSRSIRSLNLGEIYDIWDIGKRFVISEMLKGVFESEGVTGLKYEPCLIEHQKGKGGKKEETKIFENRFYVAEITSSFAERAEKIYLLNDYYCKRHSIIFRFDGLCNRVTPRNAISQNDFQMVNRVIVKGKEYYYRIPFWFVSRKVLKILLKHAAADLRQRGPYLKKSFLPVPMTDLPNCSPTSTPFVSSAANV